MANNYTINDIESLSFADGVRKRIAMYLGSADMQGVYNAIQEIISNSVDEFYMGYGDHIDITVTDSKRVYVQDYGRGVPFGIKADGSNVLVDIYSRPHTGGKFNDKIYSGVAGTNGIGAKATCLSSNYFKVNSYRDGKYATAIFENGELKDYSETIGNFKITGTAVDFEPSENVYNLEPIKIDYKVICEKCKNLSYLAKGLRFNLTCIECGKTISRDSFCATHGLADLLKDNVKSPIHNTPITFELIDGNVQCEIALQWTKGKEHAFTFTNGLYHSEGGTSLTGVKTAITLYIKKKFKDDFDGDMARTGLVYAVACKVPNPSFANQTKTKINNPELRGLCQKATNQALTDFEKNNGSEFKSIIDFLTKEKKAEQAAENARKKIMETIKDVENNQKRKVFATDKLRDAEYLGPDSVLLLVEGNSAASSMAVARDEKKYGILALRGKMINCLSNKDEDIFDNEEIKLLLSALNITPGNYSSGKLRYGKVAICTDADSDGSHIGLLIMAALRKLAPKFLDEGRLYWLRSPLYIVKNGKNESYYFTDAEMDKVRNTIRGEIQRNKGLGSLSADQAHASMFDSKYQRLEPLIISESGMLLLEDLMGEDADKRREYIFNNIDFSTIKE